MATEVETWSTAQQHEGELSLLLTQCLLIVSITIACKRVEGHIEFGLCEDGCVLQSIVQERDGLRYQPCSMCSQAPRSPLRRQLQIWTMPFASSSGILFYASIFDRAVF